MVSYNNLEELYKLDNLVDYQAELNKLMLDKDIKISCDNILQYNLSVLEDIMSTGIVLDIFYSTCSTNFILYVIELYPRRRWNLILTEHDMEHVINILPLVHKYKLPYILDCIKVNIDREDIIHQYLGTGITITTIGFNSENYTMLLQALTFGMKIDISRKSLNICYCDTLDNRVRDYILRCGYKIIIHDLVFANVLNLSLTIPKYMILIVSKETIDEYRDIIDFNMKLGMNVMCYTRLTKDEMKRYINYEPIPRKDIVMKYNIIDIYTYNSRIDTLKDLTRYIDNVITCDVSKL